MKTQKLALLLLILIFSVQAQSAILVEDGGKPVSRTSQSYSKEAVDGDSFRSLRRAGLGLSLSGPVGSFGALLDLNFSSRWAGSLAYGGSLDFQSVVVQAKHYFTSTRFAPYFGFGYTRWFKKKSGVALEDTTPSYLFTEFLSDEQKSEGGFAENLLFSSIGVQFFQTKGEWAGYSFGLEVNLLMDPVDLVVAPTGAFNMFYYF